MLIIYIFLTLLTLLALAYVLRPFFRSRPAPFPQNPRPEEIRYEAEVLKAQAKEAEGEERKRLLALAVRLERQLADSGPATPAPRRLSPVIAGLAVIAFLGLGSGLWWYTFPRLPGDAVVSARNGARELAALQSKAQKSNTAADWLAFANRAYGLHDFERAATGYVKVAQLEPKNVTAIRRLGILLFMGGRGAQAISILQIATSAEPNVAEGWLFLGNALFESGKPKEAIAAWEGYLKAGGEAKKQVQNLIQTAKAQLSSEVTAPGQRVFLRTCAVCHGAQAQGNTGPELKGNPIIKIPQAVTEIITKGRGAMPAVQLTPKELKDLLDYLKGL